MAVTPEQRSEHPLCGARKRNGELCRAYAGQGTDHFGVGRCSFHLGKSPSHKRQAVELEAKARMVKLGQPIPDARPHQVLLGLLSASAGHCAWLQREVAALDDLGTDEAAVVLRLHDTERDRCARIALACSQAGVDQAEINFQEAQAIMIVGAIRDAAKEIGLNRDQLAALGSAMRKQMAELSGDTEAAAREEEQLRPQVERIRAAEAKRIEKEAARRRPPDLAYPPEEWVPEEPPAA